MLQADILRRAAILCLTAGFCLLLCCFAGGQQDGAEPPEGPPPGQQPPPSASPSDQRPPLAPERPGEPDLSSMLAATTPPAVRSPIGGLAGLPNMFGDYFCHQLHVCDFNGRTVVEVPPAGGARYVKISDNNKAMPTDRVYFVYNHFQNALDVSDPFGTVRAFPLDRYVIGVEKTFRGGLWSAEVRLPLAGAHRFESANFSIHTEEVGNLAVVVKRLLYQTDRSAVALGLGIDTPTAPHTTGQGGVSEYLLYNQAVHLAPYVGFLTAPGDRWFYQGFLQVDVAANGNQVDFGGKSLGKLNEQTLLYLDLSAGRWLYRNPGAYGLSGLACLLELHYSSTLQDADLIKGDDGQSFLEFTNIYNRMDILNLTVGLHGQIGMTTVSVGGVLPLREEYDRTFDAEVQVFVNRHY